MRPKRAVLRCSPAVLLFLAACAEPSAGAEAPPTSRGRTVVDAVRVATERAPGRTEQVSVPGGSRLNHVVLGAGYQHVTVARRNADGTVDTSCVESAPQAESFLSGAPTATAR